MKSLLAWCIATLLAVVAAGAQDLVTIPRARLLELERKEAELEQLKRAQSVGAVPSGPAESRSGSTNSTVNSKSPAVVRVSTTNSSATARKPAALPPLDRGEVVPAAQLWEQFQTDPKAAAARYERARIRVAGEVVDLDKPSFVRHAIVFLGVNESRSRLACRLEPSAAGQNLMLTKGREELAEAGARGIRTPLARIGQRVVVEGWCRHAGGGNVTLTDARIVSAP
jgi:hypothetical protein